MTQDNLGQPRLPTKPASLLPLAEEVLEAIAKVEGAFEEQARDLPASGVDVQ
jgi:hypothetical protein